MKNWTIGKRITIGFTIIIAIVLALGVYASGRISAIRNHSDRIAKVSVPMVEMIGRVERNAENMNRLVYMHIGSSEKADMARLEEEIATNMAENEKTLEQIEGLITTDKGRALMDRIKSGRSDYTRTRVSVLEISRQATNNEAAYNLARSQMEPASQQYLASLTDLIDFINHDADDTSKSIQETVQTSQTGIIAGMTLACIFGIAVAWIIVRGTSRVLRHVSGALGDGSHQVASAANQVSSASQSFAQGSSEQAASIEETSSSLEELASMSRSNAEQTEKCRGWMAEGRTLVTEVDKLLAGTSSSIQEINQASEATSKVIKTIEEIAFQTNILALNAAVEAARAGEAGMGFAVVADEVRNLAQRCAQAARETSVLIENATNVAHKGTQLTQSTQEAFKRTVTKIEEVGTAIEQIASSVKEQSQGIAQINVAIGQMDKVTQGNAANAEESAAAAEELNAQALAMKDAVAELLALVGSGHAFAAAIPMQPTNHQGQPKAPLAKAAAVNGNHHGNGHVHAGATGRKPAGQPANALLAAEFKDI